jgi:hypothetical protein
MELNTVHRNMDTMRLSNLPYPLGIQTNEQTTTRS